LAPFLLRRSEARLSPAEGLAPLSLGTLGVDDGSLSDGEIGVELEDFGLSESRSRFCDGDGEVRGSWPTVASSLRISLDFMNNLWLKYSRTSYQRRPADCHLAYRFTLQLSQDPN
jgi:hypothetical protein